MAQNNHELFLRPKDTYGVTDLCAYARDILYDLGEDPAQTGRVVAHWYSDLANITLMSSTLAADNPTYQANVQDNRAIGHHRVYTITPNEQSVKMFDMHSKPMIVSNPDEMIILMMFYLRSNPSVFEPRLDARGAQLFQAIAANVAIDAAIDGGRIDLGKLALTSGMPFGVIYANQARDAAKEQGVATDDTFYRYTSNNKILEEELSLRVRQRQTQLFRSLPPAIQEDDQL